MRKWLLLAAAISCEVTASLSLKGALDAPALYVVVVAGYVASFAFLALVLRAGLPSVSPTASGVPSASR